MPASIIFLWSCAILAANAFTLPAPTPTAVGTATQVRRDATTDITSTPSTGIYFMTTEYVTIDGQTDDHVTRHPQTISIAIPTCIQTITADANGYLPPGTCNAIWDYYPNFSAAAIFAALFGALTLTHIWQAVSNKKGFCWVIIMASAWETCAFTSRAISTKYQQSIGVYLVFQIFILLSPLWVNAFDYMVLGRMIYYFIPSNKLIGIPAAVIAAIFVALDFVSFVVQLVGGSMAGPTSPPDDQLKAIHVYMGGIGLQQFFIFVFAILALKFQMDMSSMERGRTRHMSYKPGWRRLLYTVYLSLGLITVRIMFRLIEFSRGNDVDNPLLTSEAYFYLLEAVPMFLAILSFNFTHPGSILKGPESEMPGFFTVIMAPWRRNRGKQLISDSFIDEVELAIPKQRGFE